MRAAFDQLGEQAVDGIIILVETHRLDGVAVPEGLPVVVVDSSAQYDYPIVDNDQAHGARLATEHLLDLGHETVWHVAGPELSYSARRRRTAWQETLEAHGRTAPPVLPGDWSAGSGYEAGLRLADDDEVTAVFTANDQMALGLLRALHERGRRVPDDVSVVGFDDMEEAAYFWPPLTTVRQSFAEVGKRAVDALIGDPVRGAPAPRGAGADPAGGPGQHRPAPRDHRMSRRQRWVRLARLLRDRERSWTARLRGRLQPRPVGPGGLGRGRPADAPGRRQHRLPRHLLLGPPAADRGLVGLRLARRGDGPPARPRHRRRPRHRDRLAAAVAECQRTRRSCPVTRTGETMWPGARQHWRPTSPVFRQHALAARRGDGEPLRRPSGARRVARLQRARLPQPLRLLRRRRDRVPRLAAERYGDLDALNHAWGTAFWSQRYSDWDQILPPRLAPTIPNPTHAAGLQAVLLRRAQGLPARRARGPATG